MKSIGAISRSRSRAAATSRMERFVIIGFQPLTIITKPSSLDVAAALDPPLVKYIKYIILIEKEMLFLVLEFHECTKSSYLKIKIKNAKMRIYGVKTTPSVCKF